MKKILVTIIIASLLGMNTVVYAAEGEAAVDPGITPDSILYGVDKLAEEVQLLVTPDSEGDAQLLLDFAQERLAEAEEMTEQEKPEYAQAAVDAYVETIGEAQEVVLDTVVDESVSDEVKDELTQELGETADAGETVEGSLTDEQQEVLEETTEEISFAANVVKGIDTEVVASLREKGFGFGQIAHVAVLAQESGKTVDEIASMIKDEKRGIGALAKELGVKPSKLNKKALADVPDGTVEDGEVPDGGTAVEDGEQTEGDGTAVEGSEGTEGGGTAVEDGEESEDGDAAVEEGEESEGQGTDSTEVETQEPAMALMAAGTEAPVTEPVVQANEKAKEEKAIKQEEKTAEKLAKQEEKDADAGTESSKKEDKSKSSSEKGSGSSKGKKK